MYPPCKGLRTHRLVCLYIILRLIVRHKLVVFKSVAHFIYYILLIFERKPHFVIIKSIAFHIMPFYSFSGKSGTVAHEGYWQASVSHHINTVNDHDVIACGQFFHVFNSLLYLLYCFFLALIRGEDTENVSVYPTKGTAFRCFCKISYTFCNML